MQGTTDSGALRSRTRAWRSPSDPTGTIWWLLRIAASMCFIGHGAFGVIGKEEWLPFFAAFGIPAGAAWTLMPIIGAVDIALGVLVLVAPSRAVFLYMAVWAVWTAALRPLTGNSAFELLERAGNYGVPIALLVMVGSARSMREMVATVRRSPAAPVSPAARRHDPSLLPELTASSRRASRVRLVLAWTTAMLLIGHGTLAAIERKPLLMTHVEAIGLPAWTAVAGGWLEIALALVVLARPQAGVLIAVVLWKLATEMLYPIAGAPIWEVIERGGSYGAPLGLALLAWCRSGAAREDSVEGSVTAASVLRGTTHARRLAAAVAFAGLALAASAPELRAQERARAADSASTSRLEGAALVQALRRGGLVLAFRHTTTDGDARDVGPAREQQRNLTEDGAREARAIGEAIRALGIPIGDVRASWMYRTRDTGELAFGRVEIDSTLRGRGAVEGLRAQLVAPVPPGTNRVVLTHIGVFMQVLEEHGVSRMAEGDIIVVEPLGEGGFRVLAHLTANDWAELPRDAR